MSKTTTKAGADKAPAITETEATSKEVTTETASVDQKVADLELALKAAQDALAAEQKKSESLKAELEDAAEVIEELKLKLKESDSGKSDKPLVTINKVTYKVMSGMVKKKKSYTAAEIAADKALAAELLEKGSTILKPVK